jgi:hypothetical protein
MKHKYRTAAVISIIIAVNIVSSLLINGNQAMSNTSGSPAARTGSPGDVLTCTACHSGPAPSTQTGWITSTIPAAGYVPNTTYTITATVTRPGHTKFGFEISPQNITGGLLGTLVNTSTQTHLVGSNKYITHTSSGTTGTTGFHTWTFNWTAPVTGTGAVTFYGAFNATNASNNSSGDTIFLSTLTVQEIPALTANAVAITAASCNGGSDGSASVSAAGGSLPYAYLWNTSPVQTSQTATGLSAGTYTVTVTDANNTTTVANVTITQPPPITTGFSQTNVSCNGESDGSATVIASGGTGSFFYLWNTIPIQNTTAISGLSSGAYTVIVTDANGCTQTGTAFISEPPSLTVSIIAPPSVCSGTCVSLTAISGGGTGNATYSWLPSGSSGSSILVCPSGPSVYIVTATDMNGCTKSDSTTIDVNALPVVSYIINPDTVCINAGSVFLSGGSPPGGLYSGMGIYGYDFYPDSAGIGEHTITYSFTDANSCINSDSVFLYVDVCAGLNTFSDSRHLTIYPNSNNGIFFIESERNKFELTIMNSFGKIVLTKKIENDLAEIDLSGEAAGIYFLRLETADKTSMQKIIIEK